MSGGSYNYAYTKVDEMDGAYSVIQDVKRAEERLRELGQQEAANEVYKYILFVEMVANRLSVQGNRIANVLRAVEWYDSGDSGIEVVNQACEKLLSGE